MSGKFIVTNFAYGTGPYIRTTELARAFNDELERRGHERLGIIVPLVYGEKQQKVMAEEFGGVIKKEIIFDEKLGQILGSVFFSGKRSYQESLKTWIDNYKLASQAARRYLQSAYGDSIAVELARFPRIRYDVSPAYFTSFAYLADILERAQSVSKIDVPREFLKKGVEAARWVESAYRIHAIAYPATYSWMDDYAPRYATEVLTPPITRLYEENRLPIDPGIFVTITGIPGLERIYSDADRLGYKLYSNDLNVVSAATWKLPHVIPNKNTIFQFARSGWSSVWLSMMSGTPLVVPEFDSKDDPEIYFNNLAVDQLGIGIIYRGQPLEEILKKREMIQVSCSTLRDYILKRWGTLDGNKYCAKLFADDFRLHIV